MSNVWIEIATMTSLPAYCRSTKRQGADSGRVDNGKEPKRQSASQKDSAWFLPYELEWPIYSENFAAHMTCNRFWELRSPEYEFIMNSTWWKVAQAVRQCASACTRHLPENVTGQTTCKRSRAAQRGYVSEHLCFASAPKHFIFHSFCWSLMSVVRKGKVQARRK